MVAFLLSDAGANISGQSLGVDGNVETLLKPRIVGSGFIGRAWAISFARAGASVRLWDQAEGAARKAVDYITGVLDDLAANDLLNGQSTGTVLSRITPCETLEEALAQASHVQENTPEDLATKIKVFERLDAAGAVPMPFSPARPQHSCHRSSPRG